MSPPEVSDRSIILNAAAEHTPEIVVGLSLAATTGIRLAAFIGRPVAEAPFMFSDQANCSASMAADRVTRRLRFLKEHLGVEDKRPEPKAWRTRHSAFGASAPSISGRNTPDVGLAGHAPVHLPYSM